MFLCFLGHPSVQIGSLLTCRPTYRGPRGTRAQGAPNPLPVWLICRMEGTWDHRPVPRCAISGLKRRGKWYLLIIDFSRI